MAQVQLISEDYFPASQEFQELQKVTEETTFEKPDKLARISSGDLIDSVGFGKYERRVYATGKSAFLSVEVITLQDSHAAYSLLTLLRNSDLQQGPPGDAFVRSDTGICFAQDRVFVRIEGRGVAPDLSKRVAISISNRIGPVRPKAPSLISHLPKLGYEASSLHFFPGLKSYQLFFEKSPAESLKLGLDVEIAQARYHLENHSGTLFLLSFPTAEAAEDYVSTPVNFEPAAGDKNSFYTKRAGPLVAILRGDFEPAAANRILDSLKYSYSIRWVSSKNNQPRTIWGVPTKILRTVVSSLIFAALLCVVSMVIGFGFAVVRFMLSGHESNQSTNQTEQNEIIRLRLR